MSYLVFILPGAQKELAGLPIDAYEQAKEVMGGLAQDPRPRGCQKLSGRDGWRIRVGDYRVIYEIDDPQQTVTVLHVGHRRDVYR